MVEGLVKVAEIDFLAKQLPCRFFIYLDGNHAFGYILQAVNSQFRIAGTQEEPAAFVIFVALAGGFIHCCILTGEQSNQQQSARCGQDNQASDGQYHAGFFLHHNGCTQVSYRVLDAGNARCGDGAGIVSSGNITGCHAGICGAAVSGDSGVGCRDKLIADQGCTLHTPSHIGKAQRSAVLHHGLVDVGGVVSVEAGIVLCRCHRIAAVFIASRLGLDGAVIQCQSA